MNPYIMQLVRGLSRAAQPVTNAIGRTPGLRNVEPALVGRLNRGLGGMARGLDKGLLNLERASIKGTDKLGELSNLVGRGVREHPLAAAILGATAVAPSVPPLGGNLPATPPGPEMAMNAPFEAPSIDPLTVPKVNMPRRRPPTRAPAPPMFENIREDPQLLGMLLGGGSAPEGPPLESFGLMAPSSNPMLPFATPGINPSVEMGNIVGPRSKRVHPLLRAITLGMKR